MKYSSRDRVTKLRWIIRIVHTPIIAKSREDVALLEGCVVRHKTSINTESSETLRLSRGLRHGHS